VLEARSAATSFDSFNSAEFLGELQSGSQTAFHGLFDSLQSPVCHFLANIIGIPESDVGDVYVDVLMKVHENIGTFEHGKGAKLTTWIFGIARNTAIDHHRASKKNKASEQLDEATVQHSKGGDGALAGRNTELLKWLEEELLKLPEQDQLLLKWRATGFSYAQIGEWLKLKEGTARVRYQRAMEKLLTAAKSVKSEEGAMPQ
jgi:RNA polymerase sigma-70 factor, ECF subfamily